MEVSYVAQTKIIRKGGFSLKNQNANRGNAHLHINKQKEKQSNMRSDQNITPK